MMAPYVRLLSLCIILTYLRGGHTRAVVHQLKRTLADSIISEATTLPFDIDSAEETFANNVQEAAVKFATEKGGGANCYVRDDKNVECVVEEDGTKNLMGIVEMCDCDEDGEACDCFLVSKTDLGNAVQRASIEVVTRSYDDTVVSNVDSSASQDGVASSHHKGAKFDAETDRSPFEKQNAMAPLAALLIAVLIGIVLLAQVFKYAREKPSRSGYEAVDTRRYSF